MGINVDEYARRCAENQKACERISGKPMTEEELEKLGIMVYRQIVAEAKRKL